MSNTGELDIGDPSNIILPPGLQSDGAIVDMYGRRITADNRMKIMEVVGALPVTEQMDDILHAIRNSQISIIEGATGSGKTTQVPKRVAMEHNFKKQVIVTQPRVFAARSNAARVADELIVETLDPRHSLGYGVGYRTGQGVSSPHTSPLSFHTDALELVRQLISGKVPDILFLDEVHNFSIPTEMLAMLMKRYRKQTKLIIMSATLDPKIFQEYYRSVDSDIPVIQVPGRMHPVEHYYEDGSSGFDSVKIAYKEGKNVLLFAAGKKEIMNIIEQLKKEIGPGIDIFPLHRDMPKSEQEFLLTNTTGKPRIVVATNIAEESVTIDYMDVVFNLGTHKVSQYNYFGIPELRLQNASQANAKQRAGRVGRTHIGEAIYSNETPFSELREFPEAPIEREMIDRYILLCLAQDIDILQLYKDSIKKGEKLFFHNFNKALFKISLQRLHAIGAITSSNTITSLGRDLLSFPLDVYHARMLRESIERGCTEDIVYATAILDKKGFLSKDDAWKRVKIPKPAEGDIFTYIELFKLATSRTITKKQKENLLALGIPAVQLEKFEKGKGNHKLYEVVNLDIVDIKTKNIKEIDELVDKLKERLTEMKIDIVSSQNTNEKKICLASGSLHSIFQWDQKLKKMRSTDRDNPFYFTLGDVSVVKPKSGNLYIGSPFIIGGDDEKKDFPLVTFVTPIDEYHIRSIHHQLDTLFTAQSYPQSNTQIKVPQRTPSNEITPQLPMAPVLVQTVREKQAKDIQGTPSQTPSVIPVSDTTLQVSSGEEKVSVNILREETLFPEDVRVKTYLTREDAVQLYAMALEKYQRGTESNQFQTEESNREYYLRYCLPDLLIGYNHGIIKYLRDKSPEEIFMFRELIVQLLLSKEVGRIHPNSIQQTERSFIFDSNILEDFLESKNPYIRAFREGRPIPHIAHSPKGDSHIDIGEEGNMSTSRNEKLMTMQNTYAQAVGKMKKSYATLNVQEFKIEALTKYLHYMENNSESYSELVNAYKTLGNEERELVSSWIAELKKLNRSSPLLKKLQLRKDTIGGLVTDINHLISGKEVDVEAIIFKLQSGEIAPGMNLTGAVRYVRWANKGNKLQKSKAQKELKKTVVDLGAEISKLEIDIADIQSKRNMDHIPVASTIHAALAKVTQQFFLPEYYHRTVSPHLFEITRSIVRDQQTENKGLDTILRGFFEGKDFGHSSQVSKLFHKIDAYNALVGTLEEYKDEKSIYGLVKETMDTEYVEKKLEEMYKLMQQLQIARNEVDKLVSKIQFKEISNSELAIVGVKKAKKLKFKVVNAPVVTQPSDNLSRENIKNPSRDMDSFEKEIQELEVRQSGFLQYHEKLKLSAEKDIKRAQYVLDKEGTGETVSRGKYRDADRVQLKAIIKSRKSDLKRIQKFLGDNENQLDTDAVEYADIVMKLRNLNRRKNRKV